MTNYGRIKTIDFFNELERLTHETDPESFVEDSAGRYNEKEYLTGIVNESRELINYGEWFVALEIAVDNLYEVDYKLSNQMIELAEFVFKHVSENTSPYIDSYLNTLKNMRKG